MNGVDIRDLQLSLGSGFHLGPLDMELPVGSRSALVGPSGCGKTTLLRCIAGLVDPNRGRIQLGDRVVHGGKRPIPPGDRRIGFVFQDGGLWPHLTALAHLRFANPRLDPSAALDLLRRVELHHRHDSKPGTLSGGERQRLALARALAGEPDLLLLDEPLGSVDVALRNRLALLIRRLAEERDLTLLLVTHDRDEALAIADELLVMQDGRILEGGAALSILRAPRTAFGAAFLTGATCLTVTPADTGYVESVFGRLPFEPKSAGPHALVLMPGDVRHVRVRGIRTAVGRVLEVHPEVLGQRAVVELANQTVLVACDLDVAPGQEIHLELFGDPRVLPMHPEPEAAS